MHRGLTAIAMLIVGAAVGLSACATSPVRTRASVLERVPSTPPVWREDFGDPVLRRLLDQADLGNLDIKAALARVEGANAAAALARAESAPQVQLGLGGVVGAETFNRFRKAGSPTLDAAYEVDLWGRLKTAATAADDEVAATAYDVEAARRLVAAQVTGAYVARREAQQAEATASRVLELARRRDDLIKVRAGAGAASADDLRQSAAVVAEADNTRSAAGREAEIQRFRLAVLLGGETEAAANLIWTPAPLPAIQTPRSASIRSDDVDHRPDVRAAFARLQAADAHRASLIAATRPQFQIVAALGAVDAAIANLLDVRAVAWAVAGTLTRTVMDGGAGRARVAQAVVTADLAEVAWRKSVLEGWIEMQTAVHQEAGALASLSLAQARLEDAQAALRVAEQRHREGVIDGVAMADAGMAVEAAVLARNQAQAQSLRLRALTLLATGEDA